MAPIFAGRLAPVAYYRCISRVVGRRLAFGPEEKEQFVRLMQRLRELLPGAGVVLLRDVQPLPHHGGGQEAAGVGYFRMQWLLKRGGVDLFQAGGADAQGDAGDLSQSKGMTLLLRSSRKIPGPDVVCEPVHEGAEASDLVSWISTSGRAAKGTLWEERFTCVLLEGGAGDAAR